MKECEYYNIDDVSDILGVSRSTAYKLSRSDGFPSARIGKKILIDKEMFNVWRRNIIGRNI